MLTLATHDGLACTCFEKLKLLLLWRTFLLSSLMFLRAKNVALKLDQVRLNCIVTSCTDLLLIAICGKCLMKVLKSMLLTGWVTTRVLQVSCNMKRCRRTRANDGRVGCGTCCGLLSMVKNKRPWQLRWRPWYFSKMNLKKYVLCMLQLLRLLASCLKGNRVDYLFNLQVYIYSLSK